MLKPSPSQTSRPVPALLRGRAISRRLFMVGAIEAGAAALLVACSGDPKDPKPATGTSMSNTPIPGTPPSANTGTGSTASIVTAANVFLATLSDAQRATVNHVYPAGQKTATP